MKVMEQGRRFPRGWAATVTGAALVVGLLLNLGVRVVSSRADDGSIKGYGITRTGLKPKYPEGYACSPLTSLYASWKDVDGSGRDEPHSGVDGGRFGDPILAPGPGVVRAVWQANWGWGPEGALLIRHSSKELNLDEGVPDYYSAFYHLNYDELGSLRAGQRIERGQVLAHVWRPGGKPQYLPEVHWEVYELGDDDDLKWHEGDNGFPYWTNNTARLVDPLYMMSREPGTLHGTQVIIEPFRPQKDYGAYRGFTYILPCEGPKP
jgi:murein DD-endopeptidase MepM/ murein hydrolase activator NlpD